MSDEPKSAADPRPGNKPYYIDSECPYCGGELVLFDTYKDSDIDPEKIFHDEWVCPPCYENNEKGLYLDLPEHLSREITRRRNDPPETFIQLGDE